MSSLPTDSTSNKRKLKSTESSATVSSKRARSGRRSRVGCLTCKEKHVKCDETRPACRRCTDKGWTCGGYGYGLKWSYKHQPTPISPASDETTTIMEGRTVTSGTRCGTETFALPQVSNGTALDPPPLNDAFAVFDDQQPIEDCEELVSQSDWTSDTAWCKQAVASKEHSSPSRGSCSSQQEAGFGVDYSSALRWSNFLVTDPSEGSPNTAIELIRQWFSEVCPAWSGFDSNSNMNRELAGSLWQSSEPVFMCLQSMAASFMSSRLPRMRQPAHRLLKKAVASVQADIESSATLYYSSSIPTTSLFSLLCLGTSVCWLDARRVGSPFLRQAKHLFEQIDLQSLLMDAEQLRMLQYFEKSLGYWEMLVSVVADDEAETGVERQSRETAVAQVTGDGNAADILPHPWTGISSLSSQLFGQAVRLCRVYRQGITNPTGRASSLLTAMQRIDEARNLEERILDLDFASAAHLGDTGDTRTPRSHLVLVAEAYQLAALLQLYITFPDLVSLRLPHERNLNQAEDVPWNKWIVPLALRLVNVLEQIPPESGSRMMQPLLYICAGAGLRRDSSVAIDTALSGLCILRPATPSGMKDGQVDMMAYVDQIDVGADEDATDENTPGTAMDVDEARNFINARLDLLKRTLHPNPIIVTAQLLKAVWAAYDAEPAGSTSVHWFDVMEKTGLRSLFG